jgi:hypothetical protein
MVGLVLGGETIVTGSSAGGLDLVEKFLLLCGKISNGGSEDFVKFVGVNIRLSHFFIIVFLCLFREMVNQKATKAKKELDMSKIMIKNFFPPWSGIFTQIILFVRGCVPTTQGNHRN